MKDRFTEASAELSEKNPYIYASSMTTYGHQTIGHLESEHPTWQGYTSNTRGAECILNCDPMPFGD